MVGWIPGVHFRGRRALCNACKHPIAAHLATGGCAVIDRYYRDGECPCTARLRIFLPVRNRH
jgi:hypothetical protein